MNVGREWLIDAAGCDPELLQSPDAIRSLCARILRELELRLVGDGLVHQFPDPGGVTALYLLTESHLACHTYPEHGIATFNLHCCRQRPEWPWNARLREHLRAQSVVVRQFERGETSSHGFKGEPETHPGPDVTSGFPRTRREPAPSHTEANP